MPGAQHRFEFEGKEPLAIWIVTSLLFANTILMLLPGVAVSVLNFTGKYFLPKDAPEMVHWYEANSITIQFVLLALLAVIFIAFRKRVRYIRRK
jgi:fatty acid desaturase